MSKPRRVTTVVALAAAFIVGFAPAALALGSGSLDLGDDAMRFQGSWRFYPQGTGHGGLVVSGSVCDTAGDGHGVYGQGKVHGYSWSAKRGDGNGSASGCGSEGREFYDPATVYSSYGWYRICRDDFGPDTCDQSSRLNR